MIELAYQNAGVHPQPLAAVDELQAVITPLDAWASFKLYYSDLADI